LESANGPSAKAPRYSETSQTTHENVISPTNTQDRDGGQTLAKERVNRGKSKVQAKSRSDTWNRDQLTPSAAQRQAGSLPDRTRVTEQEGTVNPAGETTEILTDETMENDGNGTHNELKREWDDEPIFPWGIQDVDPDPIAMQSDKETMRAPPLMGLDTFGETSTRQAKKILLCLDLGNPYPHVVSQ